MAASPLLTRVRNRTERLRQRRWRLAPYRSSQRHIVMGGAPRSGTTLLRKLLDRHPQVCAGPETKLFVPAGFNLEWLAQSYGVPLEDLQRMRAEAPSQAAFVDAFASQVLSSCGKVRWAEKTPMNIRSLDWILERFPAASVVHIIRDGRDVICSMRQHPDWRWSGGGWHKVLVPRSLGSYADRWLTDTARGMAWRHDPRYVELRYEDLVADPQDVLRRICERLSLDAPEAWLEEIARPAAGAGSRDGDAPGRPDYGGAVSDVSVGRWRVDLDPHEQAEVARRIGPRLRELGYET